MAQSDRQFKLDLSDFSPEEREAIALEVIDRIKRRTKSGLDKDGKPFAGYSEAYKKSQDFKIAGKSSKVNLVLSGDMLDSIEIIDNFRNGKVVIGYTDETQGGKAEGNILGTYGQQKKVGPARDFLGISDSELDAITRKYGESGSRKAERRAIERLRKEGESTRLSGRITLEDLEDD